MFKKNILLLPIRFDISCKFRSDNVNLNLLASLAYAICQAKLSSRDSPFLGVPYNLKTAQRLS